MGIESELGPIDPSINNIPVEFILNAPAGSFDPIATQLAQTARDQTTKLARDLLSTGMMKNFSKEDISKTIDLIATRDHYHSHGSVIDSKEAKKLNFNVIEFAQNELIWQKIWLLRTMYSYDCGQNGYSKLFESSKVSTAVSVQKPPQP